MTSKENLVSVETKTVSDTVNSTRRKFTSAGLATSGVVMTLASSSVLGAGLQITPSGFTSGNLSRGTPNKSLGKTPGEWLSDTQWDQTKSFNDAIYFKESLTTTICSDILKVASIQAYFLTALLNSRAGLTPFLTSDTIFSMHNQWKTSTTYFEPSTKETWSEAKITSYLLQTFS